MIILTGQQLVNAIRKEADKIKKRLWIAVPFIGSQNSVTSVLGSKWFENPKISIKLLTDASDFSNFNLSALQLFLQRGEIRDLLGLHAKVYLIDDICFITSANLTNTAFSKRYEIGFVVKGKYVNEIENVFRIWWKISKPIENIKINKIINDKSEKQSKEDKLGKTLPSLWKMPPSQKIGIGTIKKKFLDYPQIISEYQKFAEQYQKIQRVWKYYPIYLEIDTFLNYLYHEAPRRPTFRYRDKSSRKLNEVTQRKLLRKYAKEFKNYLQSEENPNHIKYQLQNHHVIKRIFGKQRTNRLTKKDILQAFDHINALGSYPINKVKILNNNSLGKLRHNLYDLLYGSESLPARMNQCSSIKFMGTSIINEIVGYHNPYEYPIVNRNSSAGLRFFGFNIPRYR